MKTNQEENNLSTIKTEVNHNFELYIKILSHYNMGKEKGQNVEEILLEYGLQHSDWKQIAESWKTKLFNDPYLSMEMISLLEKYNEYFSSIYGRSL